MSPHRETRKPCPFCGKSDAEMKHVDVTSSDGIVRGKSYVVECQICFARGGACLWDTHELAWAAWNRRAESALPEIQFGRN